MTTVAQDPLNQPLVDEYSRYGAVPLGLWASHNWRSDPKHFGFTLARYKFPAKMLAGKKRVLEVGCGDGFCAPVVLQTVERVVGVDVEPLVIDDARKSVLPEFAPRISFAVGDLTRETVPGPFDAAYSLDVIEHIPPSAEHAFLQNVCRALTPQGVFIVGTPNITASQFASPSNVVGHINLKSHETLKAALEPFFHNVFLFSMNDEVLHTGFSGMAHYVIAMGVGLKT